jgi:predicted phosphate transport protein (TIGR00153 family)
VIWRDVFTTRPNTFVRLLEEQARITADVTRALDAFVHTEEVSRRNALALEASNLEHEGDRVRADILSQLQQSFVTPFDREDINTLSRAVDDIADYAENTIKEIELYRVTVDRPIREMVINLRRAAEILHSAIELLGTGRAEAQALAQEAKRLENHMEALYRQAIADLARYDDILYVIKLREIYRHLSNSADRVDNAGNIIVDIVVKEGA